MPLGRGRTEEIERTRLFIRMGWALSALVILTFPFVDAPRVLSIVWGSTLIGAQTIADADTTLVVL